MLLALPFLLLSIAVQPPPGTTPDSAFEGVVPPDWVLDGAAKVFLSLEDIEGIEHAAGLGASILHTGGPSTYFPLRRDDANSGVPQPERERMLQGIAVAKAKGLRVVLGVSPYAPIEVVRQHPEWILHPTDDRSIEAKVHLDLNAPEWIGIRSLPLNTPYGDYAIECLAEILADYQVDGFSFDGCYHAPINFSPYEKDRYREATGKEIPERIDLANPEYRRYLLWADEELEHWYRKLGVRLQEVNPEAVIYTWTTNAGRFGHFLTSPRVMSARMNRLIHCPVQEWWLDEVNLGATVVPYFGAAYVRAVSGGRVGACEPYLMSHGNPYSTDSFPAHELTVRCLGAMTNGAFTPLAQMAGKGATHATLHEIARRRETFTRLEQEPWGAIVVSEPTRQFYAYGNVLERWLYHALGFYRLGMEEHLPLALITEVDLKKEVLDRYRVLILPNVACLSDEQAELIRGYVHRGGGLVATCETSLCDELGNARPDFALSDLFGVRYGGRAGPSDFRPELDVNFALAINDSYWAKRGNVGTLRFGDFSDSIFYQSPKLRSLLPSGQATFKGPLIRPTQITPPMKPGILYFPEGSRDAFPVAAYGQQGEGRVVYLGAGIDAALFQYAFPYQRELLSEAVRWAARSEPPIRVNAPKCVQSTFWSKHDGRRIVHLWNGINSTSDHGLQESEVPLREESIPIHGIELTWENFACSRVICQPEGIEIPIRREGGMSSITVPPLHVHMAVVFEPE